MTNIKPTIAFMAIAPLLTYANPSPYFILKNLEKASNGRLGVYAINTANNQRISYRANERFPLCSTAKIMAVSAALNESKHDKKWLTRKIHYSAQQTNASGYAPITTHHLTNGMTIRGLCAAAIQYSDNTAMNLLTKYLHGTQHITSFARAIGDQQFRLDRTEPSLNTAIPDDLRDTTTPKAMASSLKKLAFGNILAKKQQQSLIQWLKRCKTGYQRIRAGTPKSWVVADKTGTGNYGSTNDIAIIWPPNAKPIVLAIYFTQPQKKAKPNSSVIASATKIIINKFHARI